MALAGEPYSRLARVYMLVADRKGIEYFTERHELGLFTADQYLDALERAGLKPEVEAGAADGRDRYVGLKPPSAS